MSRHQPPRPDSRLPAAAAFVVQLRAGTRGERGPLVGRVEHVTSGRATHFTSSTELLAFLKTSADLSTLDRRRQAHRRKSNKEKGERR